VGYLDVREKEHVWISFTISQDAGSFSTDAPYGMTTHFNLLFTEKADFFQLLATFESGLSGAAVCRSEFEDQSYLTAV